MIREIAIIDGWQMIVRSSMQHAVSVTTRTRHLRILTNELGIKTKMTRMQIIIFFLQRKLH